MGKTEFDMEIKEKMQREIELPFTVEDSLEEAYRKIRQEEIHMKQLDGNTKKKRRYRLVGIAAAAACMVFTLTGILYVNPALAKDIPIIGDVFAKIQEMRDSSPYPDKDKTAYQNIADHAEPVTDPTNVAESAGITMTVFDAYCDGFDLYYTLALQIDDEELNQADFIALLKYKEGEKYPYPTDIRINGIPVSLVNGTTDLKKAEDGLFVGLIRIQSVDLKDRKFPENMTITADYDVIAGDKMGQIENTDPYASPWLGFRNVEGSWKLQFNVTTDTSNNRTAAPNIENNSFIIQKIAQTPSNTHITLYIPSEWAEKNPEVILSDSDGNRVYQESSKYVKQEDGSGIEYMIFNYSDANQFSLKIYDKSADTEENGLPPLLAEIPFSFE